MPFRVFNLLLSIALSSSGLAASSSFRFLQHTLGTNSSAAMFLTCICLLCGFLFLNSTCRRPRLLRTITETIFVSPSQAVVPVSVMKLTGAFGWQFFFSLAGLVDPANPINKVTNTTGISGRALKSLSAHDLQQLCAKEDIQYLGYSIAVKGPQVYDPEVFTASYVKRALRRGTSGRNSVNLESCYIHYVRVGQRIHTVMASTVTVFRVIKYAAVQTPNELTVTTYFKLSPTELSQIKQLFTTEVLPRSTKGKRRCFLQTHITSNLETAETLGSSVVGWYDLLRPSDFVTDMKAHIDLGELGSMAIQDVVKNTPIESYKAPFRKFCSCRRGTYYSPQEEFFNRFLRFDLDDSRLARFDLTSNSVFIGTPQQTLLEIGEVLPEIMNELSQNLFDHIQEHGLTIDGSRVVMKEFSHKCVFRGQHPAARKKIPQNIEFQSSSLAGGLEPDTTRYYWVKPGVVTTQHSKELMADISRLMTTRVLLNIPQITKKYPHIFSRFYS